jgi:hypothetical protein
MTPTPENRKYFTVVVHHRTQADGTGILQNEATAIKLRSSMSPKFKGNPDIDPLENDLNTPIQSLESATSALDSRKFFTVFLHHSVEIDPIDAFHEQYQFDRPIRWQEPDIRPSNAANTALSPINFLVE